MKAAAILAAVYLMLGALIGYFATFSRCIPAGKFLSFLNISTFCP